MADDDYQEFLRAMQSVTPLGKRSRAPNAPHQTLQPETPPAQAVVSPGELAVPNVPPIDGAVVLDYRRPGLRDGDYQKLRTGRLRPPPDEHDLHGLTLPEACAAAARAIAEAQRAGCTSVCLVHGKGRATGGSRIKGALDAVLRRHPEVLGFHSVPRNTGAVNVFLRRRQS